MAEIHVDVWLYGRLARYAGEGAGSGYANVKLTLPAGSTMRHLLEHFGIPAEERGITFISGQLSSMPGLQPDLDHVLQDGDRVGIFDLSSMWPFQYRHGAAMTEEMQKALLAREDAGLHHTYRES
ncbi:MAG: MoaD/ThiS family protein [Anaerolineae bacterium]